MPQNNFLSGVLKYMLRCAPSQKIARLPITRVLYHTSGPRIRVYPQVGPYDHRVQVAHRPRSGSGIFSQGNVSITSLQFLKHSGLLASASDTSSTVKLWDVRMTEDPVAFLPAEMPADSQLPAPHLNMVPLSNHLDFNSSNCLLYTSPSPRDRQKSRMPSSA